MKKSLALICALVLICSIAVTALASCTGHHFNLVYQTSKFYTKPYWTQCANNPYTHAHTRKYKDLISVYSCPNCHETYTKTTTTFLSETCPCTH